MLNLGRPPQVVTSSRRRSSSSASAAATNPPPAHPKRKKSKRAPTAAPPPTAGEIAEGITQAEKNANKKWELGNALSPAEESLRLEYIRKSGIKRQNEDYARRHPEGKRQPQH